MTCECAALCRRPYRRREDGLRGRESAALRERCDALARSSAHWRSVLRCRACGALWGESVWSSGHADMLYRFPILTEDPEGWVTDDIDLPSEHEHRRDGRPGAVAWAPSGERLAWRGRSCVYILDAGDLRCLEHRPPSDSPVWLPASFERSVRALAGHGGALPSPGGTLEARWGDRAPSGRLEIGAGEAHAGAAASSPEGRRYRQW